MVFLCVGLYVDNLDALLGSQYYIIFYCMYQIRISIPRLISWVMYFYGRNIR